MEIEEGAFVTVVAEMLEVSSVFGVPYQLTTNLREGQVVQLVRPGKNTPHSWFVREGEMEFYTTVPLQLLRAATEKEIRQYQALLKYID